jgi:hypothetical protein
VQNLFCLFVFFILLFTDVIFLYLIANIRLLLDYVHSGWHDELAAQRELVDDRRGLLHILMLEMLDCVYWFYSILQQERGRNLIFEGIMNTF